MDQPSRSREEVYVWPIVGYVVGYLCLAFVDLPTIEGTHLRASAEFLSELEPLWYVTSLIAALYGLYRADRFSADAPLVFFGALIGICIGFMTSPYVTADPGPNYSTSRWTVPFWCMVGCLAGIAFADYLAHRNALHPPSDRMKSTSREQRESRS